MLSNTHGLNSIILSALFGVSLCNGQEEQLINAAACGQVYGVATLLDRHDVPINGRGEQGGTALHWACRNGHDTVVRFLVIKGAELAARCALGATPLHWAAHAGHDTIIQCLLEAEWYVVPSLVQMRDNCGLTPLHWAVQNGSRKSLQLLLSHGANMYVEDNKAWTPFIYALMAGKMVMLKGLIEGGFKNRQNSRGFTPLNELVMKGHISLAKFWLAHDVDFTLSDRFGRNILHHAAHQGHADFIVFLAHNTHLDLDAKSKLGTPLHLAIAKGRIDVVKVLLQHGAYADIEDRCGNTPLHIVVQKSHVDSLRYRKRSRQIFHLMLDFGVCIDTKVQARLIQYGGAWYFTGYRYEEIKYSMMSMFVSLIDLLGQKYHTILPLDICRLTAFFMLTAADEA